MLTKTLSFRWLSVVCAFVLIMGTIVAACRKTGMTVPPSLSTFLDQSSGHYFITDPGVTDTIWVGVTTVSTTMDRSVSFTVSSSSGAPDSAFSLAAASVRIPAGQALGYIVVKGNFNFYNGTIRKDTLLFTLTAGGTGGIAPSDFNDSFTLVMRGPCVEGKDFDAAEFNGLYNNAIDLPGGAGSVPNPPYTVNIVSTPTGPTSATLLIQNLAGITFQASLTDTAINPGITVLLDWSDPNNLTATIPFQSFENTFFSALISGNPGGTFSSCHQTLTLYYDILIPAFGFDSGLFETTIGR
jgi:hypothetical protein